MHRTKHLSVRKIRRGSSILIIREKREEKRWPGHVHFLPQTYTNTPSGGGELCVVKVAPPVISWLFYFINWQGCALVSPYPYDIPQPLTPWQWCYPGTLIRPIRSSLTDSSKIDLPVRILLPSETGKKHVCDERKGGPLIVPHYAHYNTDCTPSGGGEISHMFGEQLRNKFTEKGDLVLLQSTPQVKYFLKGPYKLFCSRKAMSLVCTVLKEKESTRLRDHILSDSAQAAMPPVSSNTPRKSLFSRFPQYGN